MSKEVIGLILLVAPVVLALLFAIGALVLNQDWKALLVIAVAVIWAGTVMWLMLSG